MKRLALLALLALPVGAQSSKDGPWEFDISASTGWKDTGVDVQPGDLIRFEAAGKLKYSDAAQECGPEGLPRGWRDLIRAMPLNNAGRGALLARIGSKEAARPFAIGASLESRMPIAGRLFLGLNQPDNSSADGSYHVKLERIGTSQDAAKAYTGPLPQLTAGEWAQVPPRVTDPEGNPGDRVNFLVFASEDQLKNALQSVGWVIVDRSVQDTVLRGALGTLSKEAYLTMPMSILTLFGRGQDYGFAHSDPVKTVMARHHFRLWKAPFTAGDFTVWVGAGTHDIGFDRDQRNNRVTHKIDPDTDLEREYIAETLRQTGLVVKTDYYTPANPITTAKTAHGEEFHSDGRILLIYLKPEPAPATTNFGDYFCSVLKQNNPDHGDYSDCAKWIDPPGAADKKLAAPSTAYRILVIPGIMNTCVADTPAWEEGRKILAEIYGLSTGILSVPNDSSEDNGKAIAAYIQEKMAGEDKRKFILIGYSKGTPDVQTALALHPGIRPSVAAFLSVAGASGGSPIADSLPMKIEKYLEYSNKSSCKGDLAAGLNSLKRETRQRFLASYPHPFVPTYSIEAVAPQDNIAFKDKATFMLLNTYDTEHDGQVLKRDAVIPESKNLGVVKTDHLTVALAFEKGKAAQPAYPRSALFEAAIRYVLDDLKAPPPPAAPKPSWSSGWSQKP
jgi:hypothetical protein